MDNNQLGAYIKRVRTERKIRIDAVTPGSVAKLSRFENGKTNLSNEDLFLVMQRLGVGIDDLKLSFVQYQSPFVRFTEDFLRERREMTLARLNDLWRTYTRAHVATGKLADVNQLMFKAVRAQLITKELVFLDSEVERKVTQLLQANAHWLQYDYALFTLAVPFLQQRTVLNLFTQMLNEADQYTDAYTDQRAVVTSEVVKTLLLRGAKVELTQPVVLLRRLRPHELWGNDAMMKHYLLARADAVLNGTEDDGTVAELFRSLDVLGMSKTKNYLQFINNEIDRAESEVND
ncbi:helix-turn-helix domain-containing protein [Lacticaseibacillus sharpeae]|uniref:HTH cro/C1-type domain-containing protein n=1 Tax=Lacticaseibacillus sharpeae JCM 1186 = DSM 20505 TaxID=1291052 RepID=A0A0R1ZY31_9LACO|nr:helix-turn-helix transcriptional regulator [Lacticaseibacillus sharpeae]KRM55852.1 hypothetical protein FC18_GL000902 [Lacticaseibacillus sharpeae JCM 1186 = DSM 20505]